MSDAPSSEPAEPKPHSAEYFGESRDYWWNGDFLALMASRWGLGSVRSVLDVGSGVGHWGRALAPVLAPEATLVGVDREPAWVAEATERARRAGLGARFSYVQGAAEALPFADASFDFVTCQTVLIHVPDVPAVLAEMKRVVRPGGLVAVVEPNNMASSLSIGDELAERPVEELVALVGFDLRCQRGKRALGLGDNSVGEQLPGLFARAGFDEVRAFTADKASALFAPYASGEMRAVRAQHLAWSSRDFYVWERGETERYFSAGGGARADFDALWALAMGRNERLRAGLEAGTYHAGGGALTYLVSGRVA